MSEVASKNHALAANSTNRADVLRRSPKRLDIQDLRALCMVQVLLYHAWRIGSPIGVDAFIMISAFLMTSSFVRRSEHGAMPFFVERWANTFKRLLPPLVATVLLTVVASLAILPPSRWLEILTQGIASITYWQNWRLVGVSADYYANNVGLASPLQHLWSMSMQGQVFLLWPFLMTICVLLARKDRKKIRPVVFASFMILTLVSLLWLLFWAPNDASVYFDTRARIWEFSLGSAIAAAAPWLQKYVKHRFPVAWAGLLVLIVYCLVEIGTYPGPMAVVPMLAVSAILLFPSDSRFSASRFVSKTPLPNIGDISYAVYLVHWPIFTLVLAALGQPRLDVAQGCILIVVSLVVALGLTRFVDDPARQGKWVNARTINKAIVVAVSLVVGCAPLLVAFSVFRQGAADSLAMDLQSGEEAQAYPGARVLADLPGASLNADNNFTEEPIPSPFALDSQWASFPDDCDAEAEEELESEKSSCNRWGDADAANGRILIAGDSHAEQMILTQIVPFLTSASWSADAVLMGACPFGSPEEYKGKCRDQNEKILKYIERENFDAIIVISTAAAVDAPDEKVVAGLEEVVAKLTTQGHTVIGVRDNLRSAESLYDCSDQRKPDELYGGCVLDRTQYFAEVDPGLALEEYDGFHQIDMTDEAFCIDDQCPTIIGNVFVYLDHNHVTLDYARSMAPAFSHRLNEILQAI